jgi:dienelactone hydrolase
MDKGDGDGLEDTAKRASHWKETARADESAPRIEVTPKRALVDEKVGIHLLHLKPGQRVTVRARLIYSTDMVYQAQAEFVTDAQGKVDVGAVPKDANDQAPLRILWSMKQDPDAKVASSRKGVLDPVTVAFSAEVDGKEIASATLEQLFVSPDVVRTPVREKGLAGTFFRPSGKGRYPGVIVFGGSGGGLAGGGTAALFASHGYATLALAYFNYEELPRYLVEIPLEYIETAMKWMEAQESVQGDKLAVMGRSRGGELALLLGATFPQIKAVVASAPSHVVWGGFSADPKDRGRPAWTYKGKPVPFMSTPPDPDLVKLVRIADPAVGTPGFALRLANTEDVRQATIPVEKIQGPVLLISGEDDKLWPSTYMAEMVMKRLAEHKHPYPDKHLSYKGCGHGIPLPNSPTGPTRSPHPVTKQEIESGGTPEAAAFAAWDSWPRVLEFLSENLKESSRPCRRPPAA